MLGVLVLSLLVGLIRIWYEQRTSYLIVGLFSVSTSRIYSISTWTSEKYTPVLVILIVDKLSSLSSKEDSTQSQIKKISSWRQNLSEMYTAIIRILFHVYAFLSIFLHYLPSWLVPRPHRPYDAIYASLPPIAAFSESSSNKSITNPLTIAFEVWRPNPRWKRKSPGPPDFHICVLSGREPFPSLAQLELLYNSVAQRNPLGGKNGKVVLAVVDNGVSNYLTLDENLLDVSAFDSLS